MEVTIDQYTSPQRQSRVAIGIILIKFLRMTIRSFWPILLSFFIGGRNNDSFGTIIGYIALGFAAFNLIGSVLTYFRFYFHIEDGAFIIDKGILKRTKTNIPFERIQTINFKQNILHQIFGVVSLEIDTAGAKKSELTIDALKKEDAEALRSFILKEKAQIESPETSSESVDIEENEEVILHLSVPDLFKVGISQNHLKSMGILFAFVFSTLNEVTEDVPELIAEELSGYDQIMNTGWVMFLASVIIVGIISFMYSLTTTVLGNYDLKLSIKQGGLKLVKGLLNREEISVNKKKVQVVSWSDNPIRMMFKMFTLQIEQASSAEADQLKSKIKVPGSYQTQVDSVVKAVFPEEFYRPETKHRVSKLLKYRLFFFIGLIPTVIGGGISYYYIEWQALYFLIWGLFIWLSISAYYRKRTYEVNDEFLKNNRGTFGHIYELTQLYKVQSVQIKQSWYQRRKRIATMVLSNAAGSVKVPFISIEEAEALESFILYRVENDRREWM
ncbi:PH domain-containing protein [Roseivirga sp. E12]|uniref:PH domain-containing protein n=1 Tax=Roseivirga sp. E12 TaxID=2819237 RepID=UPI001ABCECCB|nr:PH domain-containing protein [Roseivirga sp. E12]MBO3699231.1 PH domain-containing protein [Roseivirga sp. E12]